MRDPRPHTGEPPALDLLNTRWAGAVPEDLLADLDGLRLWLDLTGLTDRVPVDEHTLNALHAAREAVHTAVTTAEHAPLNRVLEHGRIRRELTDEGPRDVPEVADPAWLPGWLAADNLLHLIAEAPHRIRQCAHPECVLFFYDTSKNGTRRWHSMATCGNRAKAARHYQNSSSSNR
ncbi:CGNR zinc finger domain-containing protein [Nocardia halotolerans]|uniref:CGNR zinc finger domain-containing protein n=1 Tax=Nocardia halotolerans TaxID=1755878 RepID=A0ABV8VFZ9_9NOCA